MADFSRRYANAAKTRVLGALLRHLRAVGQVAHRRKACFNGCRIVRQRVR